MKKEIQQALRKLPQVGELAQRPEIKNLYEEFPRRMIVEACRKYVDKKRNSIISGESFGHADHPDDNDRLLRDSLKNICLELESGTLAKVINATGIVVHTNLGRSPLPAEALEQVTDKASGYCTLEYSVQDGKRGSRHVHASERLKRMLVVEDSMVVNNNAAAVLVSLAALAERKEVIVSRGELVEIGGSFRIPDVMRSSGARLIEVGTTNRTRIEDYRQAVTEETGLLLKVHRSNFDIVGYTEAPSLEEISALAKEISIPSAMDMGSGLFENAYKSFRTGGFPETGVQKALDSGVDLVTFSGDKLLGGPQAGIIAGKEKYVSVIRKHPLVRAVRPCKITLAALDSVLAIYEWGQPEKQIPAVSMICQSIHEIESRCKKLISVLKSSSHSNRFSFKKVLTTGRVGGGASPLLDLASAAVAVETKHYSVEQISDLFRKQRVPIIGRIDDDRFILDMRSVRDEDLPVIAKMFSELESRIAV